MRRHMRAVYTPHKGDWTGKLCIAVSWSPPPVLSTLFCSISFITVSWLRNQAIVQLLDHEGQQKIHRGFETGPQSAVGGGVPKAIGGPGLWQTLVVTWVWMLILWRHHDIDL